MAISDAVTYSVQTSGCDLLDTQTWQSGLTRLFWQAVNVLFFPVGLTRYLQLERHCKEIKTLAPAPGRPLVLETADNVRLDARIIDAPKPTNRWIIALNSSNGSMESNAGYLRALAHYKEAHVITCNYRGVGKSEGFPWGPRDHLTDAEALVQYLLSRGVELKDVEVTGWGEAVQTAHVLTALHWGLSWAREIWLTEMPPPSFVDQSDPFGVSRLAGKVAALFWEIVYFICLPIELLRIPISRGVLPAVRIPQEEVDRSRLYQLLPFGNRLKWDRHALTTQDGATLDTFQIVHPESPQDAKEQKWILFLHGNHATYEEMLGVCAQIASDAKVNVTTGNYRGVGYSMGMALNSTALLLDGQAMLQKLLSDGVPPENIVIHGWSLGGGVGASVAAANPGVRLISDRSFSSLANVVTSLCTEWGPRFLSSRSWCCCSLSVIDSLCNATARVVNALLTFIGWEFDAQTSFQAIKSPKGILSHPMDPIMLPSCKLQGEGNLIELSGGEQGAHNTPITELPQYRRYLEVIHDLIGPQAVPSDE